MTHTRKLLLAIAIVAIPSFSHAQFFSITSSYGRYLQAHTDGEMHASNDHRGNEETWIILFADQQRNTYALKNARTGRFLSFQNDGCLRADRAAVGPWEKFFIEDAGNGWVRFRTARTDVVGTLATNGPGDDTGCGGEVAINNNAASDVWAVKSHSTAEDPGGGLDIGQVLKTVADIAGVVVQVAPLIP